MEGTSNSASDYLRARYGQLIVIYRDGTPLGDMPFDMDEMAALIRDGRVLHRSSTFLSPNGVTMRRDAWQLLNDAETP